MHVVANALNDGKAVLLIIVMVVVAKVVVIMTMTKMNCFNKIIKGFHKMNPNERALRLSLSCNFCSRFPTSQNSKTLKQNLKLCNFIV